MLSPIFVSKLVLLDVPKHNAEMQRYDTAHSLQCLFWPEFFLKYNLTKRNDIIGVFFTPFVASSEGKIDEYTLCVNIRSSFDPEKIDTRD